MKVIPWIGRTVQVNPQGMSYGAYAHAQEAWAVDLDPEDQEEARVIMVVAGLRARKGQVWIVRKGMTVTHVRDWMAVPIIEPKTLGQFEDFPTASEIEAAFAGKYGGGKYAIWAKLPNPRKVHQVELDGDSVEPYLKTQAEVDRMKREHRTKEEEEARVRTAELAKQEREAKREDREWERKAKREDEEAERRKRREEEAEKRESSKSPMERQLEVLAARRLEQDPSSMDTAVDAYIAKALGVQPKGNGRHQEKVDPLEDPEVQALLADRPDLRAKIVAHKIYQASGGKIRMAELLGKGDEGGDELEKMFKQIERFQKLKEGMASITGEEKPGKKGFFDGVTLPEVLKSIKELMPSGDGVVARVEQPVRQALPAGQVQQPYSQQQGGRVVQPARPQGPVQQGQVQAQPQTVQAVQRPPVTKTIPALVDIPDDSPDDSDNPWGGVPVRVVGARSKDDVLGNTGGAEAVAPVELTPLDQTGEQRQDAGAIQTPQAPRQQAPQSSASRSMVEVPGGLMDSGDAGIKWDEFAMAWPAVARRKSYRELLTNIQGQGEWSEWPPAQDSKAALEKAKEHLPGGIDATAWFTRIDWSGLSARVPDAQGTGSTPPDFVGWLVGEGRTKEPAAGLFNILSSVHPVTFGRILVEGANHPLVGPSMAGQVCKRLLMPQGMAWVVQVMAIASEVADQLEAQQG